jgi:C_GCAxxG_C_C family probable redox protein
LQNQIEMTRSENATFHFANAFNCSQAVLVACGQDYGLTEDQCLKIATAFGGGMARQQMTCGAVTGALMAIGLKYGRGSNDPESRKGVAYDKTLEFFGEFTKRNGSITCRDLLQGLDMNDPEDSKIIQERQLFKTACARYVQDAVQIIESITGLK